MLIRINVNVTDGNNKKWLLIMSYASPRYMEVRETWQAIKRLAAKIFTPWMMIDDFNEIIGTDEQKGVCLSNRLDCHMVKAAVLSYKFTSRGYRRERRYRIFIKS